MDEEGVEREASLIHRDSDPVQSYIRNIGTQFTCIGFSSRHLEMLNDLAAKCTYGNNENE